MSEAKSSQVSLPEERDVPVHRMRDSLFDPASWGEMDTDIATAMRRMQKQMVEMEKQMERMFEQFHRLEPISGSGRRFATGRWPSWWEDESYMDGPSFLGWRPRGLDLALPAAGSPASPIGEQPPRMLRQSSRGAAEDSMALTPYQESGPVAQRVGQYAGPVIVGSGANRKLRMRFDVRQFKPEEITVKTMDNKVMVRAVHKEESDANQVYSEYQRMFTMPPEVKPETLESALSPEGVLTLEAPMPAAQESHTTDLTIPITHEKTSSL